MLESHESHGIAPHDLTLMENDGMVAVANYGTTWQADPAQDAAHPFRKVEPRLSLIDLKSGRLVDRFAPEGDGFEVRHAAARDPAHLFAIGADYRRQTDVEPFATGDSRLAIVNTNAPQGFAFGSAPLFAIGRSGGAQTRALMAADPHDFREGQTVIYDPAHDEAIATFASSHTVAVVDARSFALKRLIRTDRFGLTFPRGVALHPDGRRYTVSGSWSGLFYFQRGTHEVDRSASWGEIFFHHSHMTAVAA